MVVPESKQSHGCGCRYAILEGLASGPRGQAAELARETLEAVMGVTARIMPTEAARLAPPLAKVSPLALPTHRGGSCETCEMV